MNLQLKCVLFQVRNLKIKCQIQALLLCGQAQQEGAGYNYLARIYLFSLIEEVRAEVSLYFALPQNRPLPVSAGRS